MGSLHTSVGPHKSCGCKACQVKIAKKMKKIKMKEIKKIPSMKKWKGKQSFNKKVLIGKHTLTKSSSNLPNMIGSRKFEAEVPNYKWDRLCEHCIAKNPHDIDTHKHGIRMGVGHSGVAKILGNEEKLHGGLGL